MQQWSYTSRIGLLSNHNVTKLTSFSWSSTGLPTNAIMRILWFLPCLCFSASWGGKKMTEKCNINKYSKRRISKSRGVLTPHKLKTIQLRKPKQTNPKAQDQSEGFFVTESQILTCATLMPVQKLMFPRGWTACSLDRILAVSGVSVVSTSQLLQRGRVFCCCYTQTSLQACALNSRCITIFQWLLCHRDQAHVVLGVAARFGVADDVDRVLLSLKPCWQEVSISHVLTVVHTGECKSETV